MYVQMRVKMSRWELVSTYKQTTAGTIQPQREKTAPRDHQLGPTQIYPHSHRKKPAD